MQRYIFKNKPVLKISKYFFNKYSANLCWLRKKPTLEDEDLTDYFFGNKVKPKLENSIDLLKLIKQVNELIILNDEDIILMMRISLV